MPPLFGFINTIKGLTTVIFGVDGGRTINDLLETRTECCVLEFTGINKFELFDSAIVLAAADSAILLLAVLVVLVVDCSD